MAVNWPSVKPVWTPTNPEAAAIFKYRRHVEKKFGVKLKDTKELQKWTIANHQDFWIDVYDYLQIQPPLPPGLKRTYDASIPISKNPVFFEGHHLNYAENVLDGDPDPKAIALVGLRESGGIEGNVGEKVTRNQLREKVGIVASALKRSGIKEGDRVAALVSNSVWAVVLFLATASVGAIFTCISPDLGAEGCISRLVQVTPKILFCDGDATYKGRRSSMIPKIKTVLAELKTKPRLYVIPVSLEQKEFPTIDKFLSRARGSDSLAFKRVPFNQPLMICYSSGTTGSPKCIVHSHGIVLNARKSARLQNDVKPGDVVLQYTSTSWIMFYAAVGLLAAGGTIIAYDGSPLYPDARQLLRLVEKFKVTYFGTSPRYLAELEINGVVPKKEFDFSALRIVYTTGAPLSAEQYHWFYGNFPAKVHISNAAGGTDSALAFISGDLTSPIYPGEIQTDTLGIEADVADAITGESLKAKGEFGEFVVRKPFPSMPAFFWGDKDGSIYKSAYFERFDNVDCWAQHDWVAQNPSTGGWVMSGRSDGVLNPSGIRFGSGEIYGIVEGQQFNDSIAETLCVGRRRPHDRDEQVFLFVRMISGKPFSDELKQKLKKKIAEGLSPRHVPKFIIEVKEIPCTINGKKVEIAVKQILSGKDVKPSSTVANPHTLEQFKKYRDLESEARPSKL